jgi:hypothetical protein
LSCHATARLSVDEKVFYQQSDSETEPERFAFVLDIVDFARKAKKLHNQ